MRNAQQRREAALLGIHRLLNRTPETHPLLPMAPRILEETELDDGLINEETQLNFMTLCDINDFFFIFKAFKVNFKDCKAMKTLRFIMATLHDSQLVRFNGSGVVTGTELALQDAVRAAELAKELQAADAQLKEALTLRDKALKEQRLLVEQRLSERVKHLRKCL